MINIQKSGSKLPIHVHGFIHTLSDMIIAVGKLGLLLAYFLISLLIYIFVCEKNLSVSVSSTWIYQSLASGSARLRRG